MDKSPDTRVAINPGQIAHVASLIRALPDMKPLAFVGPQFPPVGHPLTLDFFFAATLQQFGFWEMRDGRYHHPLIAPIEGEWLKGSDYLWCAYRRQLESDPDFFSPARQAALTQVELAEVFRCDDGTNPMPAFELHLEIARVYGQDMLSLRWTPQEILSAVAASTQPRGALLERLAHVSGYKEDPLRKKAMLLALILEQRPEQFLRPAPGEAEPPVIDYHLV